MKEYQEKKNKKLAEIKEKAEKETDTIKKKKLLTNIEKLEKAESLQFLFDRIEKYGDKITTKDIISANFMFSGSENLTEIPFDINCSTTKINVDTKFLFSGCENLLEVPKINNLIVYSTERLFETCRRLRNIPENIAVSIYNGETGWIRTNGFGFNRPYVIICCKNLFLDSSYVLYH